MSTIHKTKEDLSIENEQIKQAQQRPEKFEVLYNKYYHEIFRFIYKRMQASDTTSDIASKVFLKAMLNIKKYQFRGLPFSAWLIRIAINEINYHYRSQKKTPSVVISEADIKNLHTEIDDDNSENHLIALQNALCSLNEKAAQIIELRFFENKQFQEIASIMNITISSAKMNVYRALEKLKEQINTHTNG